MNRKCKTCQCVFEGESWMKQCRDCYKTFKGLPRIDNPRMGRGVFILAHPTVSKEEVDQWIKKKYGSVNDCSNWGAAEVRPHMRLWWNCQNDD